MADTIMSLRSPAMNEVDLVHSRRLDGKRAVTVPGADRPR